MTCRELTDFIGDYLDGELTPDVSAGFEHHLTLCPNCRRYIRSYEETVKLGKRAFEDDFAQVPPHVPEELVHAILSARSR